jgi:hypothetical protein
MKTYDLYLESGPKMRKTMVHVAGQPLLSFRTS